MGSEGEHSRFTLAGGGASARAVAFRMAASALPDSLDDRFDAAVRLELNEWNGIVEPRLVLRALCPTERGECRPATAGRSYLETFVLALEARSAASGPSPRRPVHDRTGEGFAGVAGDLISSGETVAVVCADVERRRPVLEEVIGGIAKAVAASEDPAATCPVVVSWDELELDPELANDFTHIVALDPPVAPAALDLVAGIAAHGPGAVHLVWGAKEIAFTLAVARRDLDLRPLAASIYRNLRDARGAVKGDALARILASDAPYPLPAPVAARAVKVLDELDLVSITGTEQGVALEAHERPRTDLELSPTYRAARAHLEDMQRRLRAAPMHAAAA